MSARTGFTAGAAAALLALSACSEKPQTPANDGRNSDVDQTAWSDAEPAKPAYVADGWKRGDQASWEKQIHQRNQLQNEYKR